MSPGNLELECRGALGSRHLYAASPCLGLTARADRGRCAQPEIAHDQRRAVGVAACHDFTPEHREVVVGIDHRAAVVGQCAEHGRVLRGDVGDALHEFLVLALGVVDHSDRGLGNRAQCRGFAVVIHADLDCRGAVCRAQAENGQRQADLVVEITGRREHFVGAKFDLQDGGDHFLDGGLAIAAHDSRNGQRESAPPELRQRAERLDRIGDTEHRLGRCIAHCGAKLRRTVGGDNRRGCAAAERLRHEVMTVELVAFDRDKQIAGRERARVGRNAAEPGVRTAQRAVDRPRRCRGVHHRPLHAASARVA